jgi:nitrilase
MKKDAVPDRFEFKSLYPADQEWINVGNSAIVDPDGNFIAGPVEKKEEILYAEIESKQLRESHYWFDVAGHYARPDVFQLSVRTDKRSMMQVDGGGILPPDVGEKAPTRSTRKPRATRKRA